ncbi:hypothetical protein [Nonomuraea sp. NPDC023979]|uniref:hypothetical protein n=1 Tax=Nonomuraea sp. NPDC023979 TaxID=3154796 RepID=UPI0033E48D15
MLVTWRFRMEMAHWLRPPKTLTAIIPGTGPIGRPTSFPPGEYELHDLPPALEFFILANPGLIERYLRDSMDVQFSISEPEPDPPPPAAGRLVRWASVVAAEPESDEEWRTHLQELAMTATRTEVIRFVVEIIYASFHSRVTWLARQAITPGITVLCWGLRSQIRTWAALSTLLVWAGMETAADTGLGAAILVVLAAFSALVWLVERLRDRYNALVQVLRAVPGYGPARVAALMAICGVAEKQRVGALNEQQRERLLRALIS